MRYYINPLIFLILFTSCSNKYNITNKDEYYMTKKEFIEESNYSKVAQNIILPIKDKEEISKNDLKKVYFDYGTAFFDIKYRKIIKKHAIFMKQHLDLKLILQGNADIGGQKAAHTWLALNRAKNVKDQLVKYDIDEDRIIISTNSSDNPIILGNSEEAWEKNRRVDFIYY
ncbi:Peptidoglycan-associated lipoprotein precursor [Aliarcobacter thereius]|uniref:Peptidoglycan-associated lipoprotein n=1 Tax=Aliarcobacter thereius TaxID=544718 RepID=A0A1C0B6L9_9BACT|nr:OmpA family protein [Aliarcobacter thereius]OCL98961.1 Peptidoglycan-associated lipoprotein precursor [Aliarcobacter thereius]